VTSAVVTADLATPDEIEHFFRRTTTDGRRRRFHHAVAELSSVELAALTSEQSDRVNVYARDTAADGDAAVIGIASGYLVEPTVAEVAVWVADTNQRQGVGTALVTKLVERLRASGVTRVQATVEASNTAALALVHRLAPNAQTSDDGTVLTITASTERGT
jgi:ribosomal protein S18 acetylase RimI-like enzyme